MSLSLEGDVFVFTELVLLPKSHFQERFARLWAEEGHPRQTVQLR
ncbi:hypothetical protein [Myxococcus sp. SDU36]|nr:hypothetical protein [Myxococcus sp. SDU36]